MKALVIGGGGREHALAWKLSRSPAVSQVFVAPGNCGANTLGPLVNIPVSEPETLADWALANTIDLTVVGPETALSYGAVDVFRERGLRAFGPTRAAARLETSKVWAKAFMVRHDIPTAAHREFTDLAEAERYVASLGTGDYPVVIKADGLAAGKGVTVANERSEALAAVRDTLLRARRGRAECVVVEQYLHGYEVSFMAISDGTTVWALEPSRDYKRAYDGDTGPMTGGMGAYSPISAIDADLHERIMARIIRPTISGMRDEGEPFVGVLYAGLMITRDGPMVLEFNARFGDPETQVVLPRLESDLYIVLDAALDGQLGDIQPLKWSAEATCGVVLASEGYPGAIETGYGVLGASDAGSGALIFHNGTRDPYNKGFDVLVPQLTPQGKGGMMRGQGVSTWLLPSRTRSKSVDRQAARISRDPYSQVVTAGGRVLTVVGRGRNLGEARAAAYRSVDLISFTGCWCRTDIGEYGVLT